VATKNLVYVHGAGKQLPAPALKDQLDGILFGGPLATTRVAHYSDVRWPPTGSGLGVAGGGAGRARREAAVKHAAVHTVSPDEAAEMVVRATLTSRGKPLGAMSARDRTAAKNLAKALYVHADQVARRSSAPHALGIGFFDPIFRLVVGRLASDVIDYLFGTPKAAMQAPVRKALVEGPKPDIVLAHSLGTIIAYDVLSEPALADRRPAVMVTVGCPLGIDNVQDRLRDGAGRPNPIPVGITEWTNFADRFDPVAIEATLRDEFKPNNLIEDEAVNNAAANNHDLTGYLSIGVVRTLLRHEVGVV
jgi:hypothetical protein